MELLNEIKSDTEVTGYATKNITTFTVPVGLHPTDVGKIIDLIINELNNGCQKTKKQVAELNKEFQEFNNSKDNNQ